MLNSHSLTSGSETRLWHQTSPFRRRLPTSRAWALVQERWPSTCNLFHLLWGNKRQNCGFESGARRNEGTMVQNTPGFRGADADWPPLDSQRPAQTREPSVSATAIEAHLTRCGVKSTCCGRNPRSHVNALGIIRKSGDVGGIVRATHLTKTQRHSAGAPAQLVFSRFARHVTGNGGLYGACRGPWAGAA